MMSFQRRQRERCAKMLLPYVRDYCFFQIRDCPTRVFHPRPQADTPASGGQSTPLPKWAGQAAGTVDLFLFNAWKYDFQFLASIIVYVIDNQSAFLFQLCGNVPLGIKPNNYTLARLRQVVCFHVKELNTCLLKQVLLNVNLRKFVVFNNFKKASAEFCVASIRH